jgi:hypothetical protein
MGNTLTAPSFVSTQQDLPTLLLDIPPFLHHAVLGGQTGHTHNHAIAADISVACSCRVLVGLEHDQALSCGEEPY